MRGGADPAGGAGPVWGAGGHRGVGLGWHVGGCWHGVDEVALWGSQWLAPLMGVSGCHRGCPQPSLFRVSGTGWL